MDYTKPLTKFVRLKHDNYPGPNKRQGVRDKILWTIVRDEIAITDVLIKYNFDMKKNRKIWYKIWRYPWSGVHLNNIKSGGLHYKYAVLAYLLHGAGSFLSN